MGQRRRARECALQMLFQIDLAGGNPEEVFPGFWAGQQPEEDVRAFAERLVRGVIRERARLDPIIAAAAENWRLERIATVDRNVLRIAVFELLHERDTPAVVCIDEAIEIAKRFGSEDSGGFINGVLDAIRRRVEGGNLGTEGSGRGTEP